MSAITRETYNACVGVFLALWDDFPEEMLWDKWEINMCRLVQIVFEQMFSHPRDYTRVFKEQDEFKQQYEACNKQLEQAAPTMAISLREKLSAAFVNVADLLKRDEMDIHLSPRTLKVFLRILIIILYSLELPLLKGKKIFWYMFHSRAYFLFETDEKKDLAVDSYFVCKTPAPFVEFFVLPNATMPSNSGDNIFESN